MGVGEHLVVDLAAEPAVGEDLPPRDDGAGLLGEGGAEDVDGAVGRAVVVDQEAADAGAEVEGGPFADVAGLVADDERDGDAVAPGLGLSGGRCRSC